MTDIPQRAPRFIEQLHATVDSTIARLRDEPIPRSAEAEEELAS